MIDYCHRLGARASVRGAFLASVVGVVLGCSPGLHAQSMCVASPLFSGNVGIGMPFRPEQPTELLLSHSSTCGDFDRDGRLDFMHGTQNGSLVLLRGGPEPWEVQSPEIIPLSYTPPPPGGPWVISALHAVDLNDDDKLDLVVGDYQPSGLFAPAQRLHAMLGNGNGTFQEGPPFGPVTAGVFKLCAADFDADGNLDIGFGTEGGSDFDQVGIAWGDGFGLFPSYIIDYWSSAPSLPGTGWIEPADIDNDFDADAVVDCPGTQELPVPPAILRSNGDRTFETEPLPTFGPGANLGHVFGELNGDGWLDLVCVATTNADEAVYVRLNNGTGQFLPPARYSVTSEPSQTHVACMPLIVDTTGDGRGEVAVARQNICNATQFYDQVVVFANTGNGTLAEPPPLYHFVGAGQPNPPLRLHGADLNADDRCDIIASNREATTLLINDGHGGYVTNYGVPIGPPVLPETCGNPAMTTFRLVTPHDLNSDGRFDIVAVREASGIPPFLDCAVMLQDAQGGFTQFSSFPVPEKFTTGLAAADFDCDGHPDLALTIQSQSTPGGGNTVYTARGHGDGVFDSWLPHPTAGKNPRHVLFAHLNLDQWPDLVVTTAQGLTTGSAGGISVLLNDGAGGFLQPVHYEAGPFGKWADAADLNGDGHSDIGVAYGPSTTGPSGVATFLNNGSGVFTPGPVFDHLYTSRVRFADVNTDGSPDLLLTLAYWSFEPASGGLVVAINSGGGAFEETAHLGVFRDYTNQIAATADFGADGKIDVAIAALGVFDLYGGNGDGTFEKAISYGGSRSLVAGESVIVHDFNSDGRPDLGSPRGGSVSSDGNTYAGFSILLNRTCEAPCYPDCNQSGSLTIADFGCFQTKFVQQDPYADCNQSGNLNISDFGCFQAKFVAGCP